MARAVSKSLVPVSLVGVALASSGCAVDSSCGRVMIAEMTWASASVAANVQNIILEEGYGCISELVPGDTVPTVTAMVERAEPDIAPEVWVNSVRELVEGAVDEGRLKFASEIISDGGEEGWYVPAYMVEQYPELATLDGVLARPDLFPDKEEPGKGRFYTCPPGWACQITDSNLYRAYDMEEAGFTLFSPGSGEGLSAALARAFERREPFFGYFWRPESLPDRYPMVLLTGVEHDPATWPCITSVDCPDPARNTYPKPLVRTVVVSDLAEREPEVFAFVSNFSWTNAFLTDLLQWQRKNQATGRETARYFLANHEPVWSAWVPEAVAERVKAGL